MGFVELQFAMEKQEEDLWCWVAVAISVAYHRSGQSHDQCDVAERVLSIQGCCRGARKRCNKSGRLETALDEVGHYDRWRGGFPADSEIEDELNDGRPVAIRLSNGDPTGHFAIISAIDADPGGDVYYDVLDPDPKLGPFTLSREDLTQNHAHPAGNVTHVFFVT